MLNVIAAVLIGGTAFTGGDGGLFGTVIGVMFLGIVQNGLQLSVGIHVLAGHRERARS